MGKESIRIVLAEQRDIGGIIRNPGYVLLEGVSSENLAANDVDESIRFGRVKVEVVKARNNSEEAP
ncbi:MAG: hypothetical protein WC527_06530 [Candidatus Margulisiibacteriota bacterium]